MRCHLSDDVEEFFAEAGDFLARRPVEHNLLVTLAQMRRRSPEPSRWLWVTDDGHVVGAAVQTPRTYRAALSPMPPAAVEATVERFADEAPDLPGVVGEAGTAAAFAGAWTTAVTVPAQPVEGQRLYRLGRLSPANGVPGQLRRAEPADLDLLVSWWREFDSETGMQRPPGDDRAAIMAARVEGQLIWFWEVDGHPVSMALHTVPAAGAVRVGLVFTPIDERRRGYAAACVGAVTDLVLQAGAQHCLLYTQLANPTSNAVYQRLGYEAVGEVLLYDFG